MRAVDFVDYGYVFVVFQICLVHFVISQLCQDFIGMITTFTLYQCVI